MEGDGKGDGHQYGRKPRTPESIPIAGNSPSEEEMEHWTPTGVEPRVYDDADETEFIIRLFSIIQDPSVGIGFSCRHNLWTTCRVNLMVRSCFNKVVTLPSANYGDLKVTSYLAHCVTLFM